MAKTDYAMSIARKLKVNTAEVSKLLRYLEEAGLIERSSGSAIKKTEAKLKLTLEVRKHHLYFKLSRDGELLIRELINAGLEEYFRIYFENNKTFALLSFLYLAGCENSITLARKLSLPQDITKGIVSELMDLELISMCMGKIIKKKHRKAKPKKETRTHHKYYRTARLWNLLYRYI
ncbi:hypothetical protein BMS3Bbin15_00133 [archaeon BMS3Bbin15]|nr:hypothetical protein BMS3Bbin15_00133 [archaeon BMS3Bbin15]